MRTPKATLLALGASCIACTTFDDAELPSSATKPDAGGVAFVSEQQALQLCAWALTCTDLAKSSALSTGVPLSAENFSLCLDWLRRPIDEAKIGRDIQRQALTHASMATSCAAPQFDIEVSPGEPDCSEPGAVFACLVGNKLMRCADKTIFRCGTKTLGNQSECLPHPDTSFACEATKACDASLCELDRYLLTCDKSRGRVQSYDCHSIGTSCGLKNGVPVCLTDGVAKPCDGVAPGTQRCAGDVLEVCTERWWVAFDCRESSAQCQELGSGIAQCQRPNAECDATDRTKTRCVGASNIQVCVDGRVKELECPKGCAQGSTSKTAHCTP